MQRPEKSLHRGPQFFYYHDYPQSPAIITITETKFGPTVTALHINTEFQELVAKRYAMSAMVWLSFTVNGL